MQIAAILVCLSAWLAGGQTVSLAPAPPTTGEVSVAAPIQPGLWSGGFGSLDLEASDWTPASLQVTMVEGGRFEGELRTSPGARVDVSGVVDDRQLRFDAQVYRRHLQFSANIEDDVLKGVVSVNGRTHDLLLAREQALDPEVAKACSGMYDVGPGHSICVRASQHLVLEDLATGDVRVLYTQDDDRFVAGPTFARPRPIDRHIEFIRDASGRVDRMEIRFKDGTQTVAHRRDAMRSEPFDYERDGVTIRGTLFLPPGPGPHPAVLWVHGSGRASRSSAGIWPHILTPEGFAVLAVDKRGVGESDGTYELPDGSHDNLPHMRRRAKDARAGVAALGADPRIDADRIGLMGASQAGWVIPLAASEGGIAFTVILSGGATALSFEGVFSDEARELDTGAELPTIEEALARTRDHVARDPDFRDEIAAMTGPALWVYGDRDRSNPTQLCVELIESIRAEHAKDFTIRRFPNGNHSLMECMWGGAAEIGGLRRRVPGLYDSVTDWLEDKKLAP